MPKKKIVVTGANGQVGQSLAQLRDAYDYNFYFLDSKALDVGDAEKCITVLQKIKPDYVINAAAYTAVDRAEEEVEAAMKVNHDALTYITDALTYIGGRLVHYSTDYVYGGQASQPISENAPTRPQSAYGRSKLYGDQAAITSAIPSLILRTAWVYSPYGHNFLKTMLRLAEERDSIRVVNDQRGTPTYAPDLARTTMDIISQVDRGEVELSIFNGIYHCTNSGNCTWYDFAKEIYKQAELDMKVDPVDSTVYPTLATRPRYSVLDNSRLEWAFGITLPPWQDSIAKCLQVLNP